MSRQCQCGGVIRQHLLTGGREAWTCGACGRYEAIERRPPTDFEKWISGAALFAMDSGKAPADYVWDLADCAEWRAMHARGMTGFEAVQAFFGTAKQ